MVLLFSDLTRSTALYERVGDAKAFAVGQAHFLDMARCVERHDGAVVIHEGSWNGGHARRSGRRARMLSSTVGVRAVVVTTSPVKVAPVTTTLTRNTSSSRYGACRGAD